MIVADNNFIKNKILASVTLLEAIPALRTLKAKIEQLEKECGSCSGGKKAAAKLIDTWNEVRQLLVGLPSNKRDLIRNHVGPGKKIRISYRTGSGKNTKSVGEYL